MVLLLKDISKENNTGLHYTSLLVAVPNIELVDCSDLVLETKKLGLASFAFFSL